MLYQRFQLVNPPLNPGRNTTNTAYGASGIHNIGVWHGFNLNALLQSYQNLLVQARLPPDPMPTSPPRAITAENALRSKISEYVFPRVRRALRTGFDRLMAINQLNDLTPVSFDVGECAEVIDAFKPDTAYFAVALPAGTGPNRAPGDVKPSWKWSTAFATHPLLGIRNEYRQALSQSTATPKKHAGRPSQLTEEQMNEIIEFISASKINRQMPYKKLIVVLHLEVNEKCLGRALKRRGYSRRISLRKPPLSIRVQDIRLQWALENLSYDTLRGVVRAAWDSITEGQLQELIAEMPARCQAVIQAGGGYTKY
ncbi:hypothetical protein ACJ73_02998 [Blastomyces percursus]|uniref:Transposase Tc1-like domain-containing protein n=1 Tax=Blastomyces percursus TaxID=1658174 RepID=A0A1J9QC15_9EURO|nr:hypothetical protein ACJ73_02998 [Blastomyces percursus]